MTVKTAKITTYDDGAWDNWGDDPDNESPVETIVDGSTPEDHGWSRVSRVVTEHNPEYGSMRTAFYEIAL